MNCTQCGKVLIDASSYGVIKISSDDTIPIFIAPSSDNNMCGQCKRDMLMKKYFIDYISNIDPNVSDIDVINNLINE